MENKYNRLKVVLAEQDKTSKWLYEELGMSKQTVSKWVRNETQPPLKTLFEVARVLNVDVCDLLERNETDGGGVSE